MKKNNDIKINVIVPPVVVHNLDPHTGIPFLPHMAAYLVSAINSHGYDVDVIDCFGENSHNRNIYDEFMVLGLDEKQTVDKIHTDSKICFIYCKVIEDLFAVERIAKRINVMYAGSIIETADIKEIYSEPKHPYTIGLIRSIPRLDEVRSRELFSIEGLPPDLLEESQHCLFAPRCKNSINQCLEEKPNLFKTNTSGHFSSCFRWKETALFK